MFVRFCLYAPDQVAALWSFSCYAVYCVTFLSCYWLLGDTFYLPAMMLSVQSVVVTSVSWKVLMRI